MGPEDGGPAEGRHLCGLLRLRTTLLLFWALDLIVLFNCLVLLLNWAVHGPVEYVDETPLAILVVFGSLVPLIVVTVSCLVGLDLKLKKYTNHIKIIWQSLANPVYLNQTSNLTNFSSFPSYPLSSLLYLLKQKSLIGHYPIFFVLLHYWLLFYGFLLKLY